MLLIFSGTSVPLYLIVAVLFGVGYGISYPILVSVAANDAEEELSAQTLQLFALTYWHLWFSPDRRVDDRRSRDDLAFDLHCRAGFH